MTPPDSPAPKPGPWTSLWVTALLSLLAQLWLLHFFSFGQDVPVSLDVNPSNLWKLAYHFPPTGTFQVLNWLGLPILPQPLNPLSLAAGNLAPWLFFTAYAPVVATLALLAMAAFLRELELSRPAALFGGVIYAWQGDILPFVYPGHYGYITAWPFFAIAAWGALRAERTGHWAYAVISGACCGTMVSLLTNQDRGGIASLLIGAFYLLPLLRPSEKSRARLRNFALCVAVAFVIALSQILAIYKSNIQNVKLAGTGNREDTYKLVTQFSLGPAETLTYLVPGFFGWHMNSPEGPYWGWIGEWPDYPKSGIRNLNLAITTTGTIASILALIGIGLVLPGRLFGPPQFSERQYFFARALLVLGGIALVLAWGWHTGFYRPLYALPLMDKWRNPLKWIEVTNFAFITLSAFGLQQLIASLDPLAQHVKIIRRRLAWFGGIIVTLLLIGWMGSYAIAIVLMPKLETQKFQHAEIANIADTMHTTVFIALLLAILGCMKLWALWNVDSLRTWNPVNPWLHRAWHRMLQPAELPLTLAIALMGLAVMQLGWVAGQFIDIKPIQALSDTNPLLDALHKEGNTVRVAVATEDPMLNTLLQNQFAGQGISSLDISAASRIPDDLNTFLNSFGNERTRLWFLTGVKNVAVPGDMMVRMQKDPALIANIKSADGYTLLPTGSPDVPSHAIVGLKEYLNKATLIPGAESFAKDEDILKRINDPTWNPRQTILLSNATDKKGTLIPRAPEKSQPTANDRSDGVDLKVYTPTEIQFEVSSLKGGYVLINDQYDPDWKVQINGKPAELLRADYILRGIPIPPGTSTVTMTYAANYKVANLKVPALAINTLSDTALIAAWLIAALALRCRRPARSDQ